MITITGHHRNGSVIGVNRSVIGVNRSQSRLIMAVAVAQMLGRMRTVVRFQASFSVGARTPCCLQCWATCQTAIWEVHLVSEHHLVDAPLVSLQFGSYDDH